MRIYFYFIFAGLIVLYSCKSESPVVPENTSSNYNMLFTVEQGSNKVEVYNATANRLVSGYNNMGFKFYINNQEKTNGFVKFFPKMYHFAGVSMHSSPTSPAFNYDTDKEMFIGYSSFFMISDPNSHWWGFVNYNNTAAVDSFSFTVDTISTSQVRSFVDNSSTYIYYITLVSPYYPKQGPNNFQCILHRTFDDVYFEEENSAEMFIKPWMETMGHGSSNNIHPSYKGGGIYEGTANFNMSGVWYVYDSIKVNSNYITPAPPPKFIFDVP